MDKFLDDNGNPNRVVAAQIGDALIVLVDLAARATPWSDVNRALTAKFPDLKLHGQSFYQALLGLQASDLAAFGELARFLERVGYVTLPAELERVNRASAGGACPAR